MSVLLTSVKHQIEYKYYPFDIYYAIESITLNNGQPLEMTRKLELKLSNMLEQFLALDGHISEEDLKKIDEEIEWYLYEHKIEL